MTTVLKADPGGPARTLTARYGKDGQEVPVSDTQACRQPGNPAPPLVEATAAHLMDQAEDSRESCRGTAGNRGRGPGAKP